MANIETRKERVVQRIVRGHAVSKAMVECRFLGCKESFVKTFMFLDNVIIYDDTKPFAYVASIMDAVSSAKDYLLIANGHGYVKFVVGELMGKNSSQYQVINRRVTKNRIIDLYARRVDKLFFMNYNNHTKL